MEGKQNTHQNPDDLILYWPNGDPAIRFQGPPNDLMVAVAYQNAHMLDTQCMPMTEERLVLLRDWCDRQLEAVSS